jgi:hypothetical protein
MHTLSQSYVFLLQPSQLIGITLLCCMFHDRCSCWLYLILALVEISLALVLLFPYKVVSFGKVEH